MSKKASQMASILNTIDQTTKKALNRKQQADEDLPYKELTTKAKKAKLNDNDEFISLKGAKKKQQQFAASASDDADDFDGDDGDSSFGGGRGRTDMEEDDLYRQAEEAQASRREEKAAKKEQRRQEMAIEMGEGEEGAFGDVADGKRSIDYNMAKNVGLTKKQGKKKQIRNPRVKQKMRYDKALKRRAGQVQSLRDTAKPYSGEQSGIKSNIVRSTKLA
jgi:U3 small nucleolar RNA-associated protein 3